LPGLPAETKWAFNSTLPKKVNEKPYTYYRCDRRPQQADLAYMEQLPRRGDPQSSRALVLEERHRLHKMLRLKVDSNADCSLDAIGPLTGGARWTEAALGVAKRLNAR